MPTTPKLAIPYVGASDALSAFPAADQAQATKIEQLIANRTSRTPDWCTAAAGWSITSSIDLFTKLAMWTVGATRTGATITVPVDGKIPTTAVANFNNVTYSILGVGPIAPSSGRLSSWAISASSGVVNLLAVAPGKDILVNEYFACTGIFFLN